MSAQTLVSVASKKEKVGEVERLAEMDAAVELACQAREAGLDLTGLGGRPGALREDCDRDCFR